MLKETVVILKGEFHSRRSPRARTASQIAQLAAMFKCDIQLLYDGNSANARSIMGILMLDIKPGDIVEFICEGENESEALAALRALVAADNYASMAAVFQKYKSGRCLDSK